MSDKHSIRNGIIIGVSVLSIWAVANWISPSVLAVTKAWLAFVIGLLGTSLVLPVWIWVPVFGALAISTTLLIVRGVKASAEEKRVAGVELMEFVDKAMSESKEPELDEVQEAIMRAYADDDVRRFDIANLYAVPFPKLIVDQAVGRLQERGFLDRVMTSLSESYTLTKAGTDYVVEQGWTE